MHQIAGILFEIMTIDAPYVLANDEIVRSDEKILLPGQLGLLAERVLQLDDLFEADEVFITSTTRELMPVHQVGERRISSGGPGAWPVMEKLRTALRGFIRVYVEEARRGFAVAE